MRAASLLVAGGLVGLVVASGRGDGAPAGERPVSAADKKYAALADYYKTEGRDFDQLFTVLCRQMLSNADNDDRLTLVDHVRSMFGGLWIWSQAGGNPVLQGRMDWALHFIGGATFEGYFDVGHSAALVKERIDTRDPGNRFDLDDLAATTLGARWMNLASGPDGRRWIELWASGQYTLRQSLPRLRYGQMPQGKEASAVAVAAIRRDMDAALTLPPPATTAPTPLPPSTE